MCLAIPGRLTAVEEIVPGVRVGTLDVGGVTRRVRLDYVPEAAVGDHVVVSMGFATATIDAEDVAATYDAVGRIVDLSGLHLRSAGDDRP